jgi:hypothetical protein
MTFFAHIRGFLRSFLTEALRAHGPFPGVLGGLLGIERISSAKTVKISKSKGARDCTPAKKEAPRSPARYCFRPFSNAPPP